jgi:phage tail-like protein
VPAETAQLLIYSEGSLIQTFALTVPVLRIGRTPDNGLSLPNQMVSRAHAEVRLEAQGAILTDIGSVNGTFIGVEREERLLPNQPHLLTDGTVFRIGPFRLQYRAARQIESEQTQAVEDEAPGVAIPAYVPPPEPGPALVPEPVVAQATVRAVPAQQAKPVSRRPPAESDSVFLRNLPDIYQENDFLRRFLRIFEEIWEPLERRQDHIEMYFDPRTCPASFLPWLASWLDLSLNLHWPEARQRYLLSQAMELYSSRGTRYGLTRMIEVCAGLTPIINEDPALPYVIRIRVRLSPTAVKEGIDRDFIEELVQAHKPAHTGYILEVST